MPQQAELLPSQERGKIKKLPEQCKVLAAAASRP
jgi:hypothetical protein